VSKHTFKRALFVGENDDDDARDRKRILKEVYCDGCARVRAEEKSTHLVPMMAAPL
jgi:hypothetical protein